MSFGSTMQFLRTGTSSGCGPIPKPLAGAGTDWIVTMPTKARGVRTRRGVLRRRPRTGFAGDVACGPHNRYPKGRARTPWGDTYWGGGQKPGSTIAGLSAVDAIRHGKAMAGTVIKTRRGTVVTTGKSVAGGCGCRAMAGFGAKVGSIPQTRGG